MDSIYASPDDFKKLNHKNKIKGLHLLEYFVNRCHEIGVLKNSLKCSVYVTRSHTLGGVTVCLNYNALLVVHWLS